MALSCSRGRSHYISRASRANTIPTPAPMASICPSARPPPPAGCCSGCRVTRRYTASRPPGPGFGSPICEGEGEWPAMLG